MKRDLIKSNYDFTEKPEIPERRDFLKKAGLVGLAIAGFGAGIGSLNGCASRPIGRGESIYTPRKRAEVINKNKLELEDFLLTEGELEGMRFARGREAKNTIVKGEMNPLKGRSSLHSIGAETRKAPLCEEWIVADYVKPKGSGLFNRIEFGLVILANRFKSEKDMKEARETSREIIEQAKRGGTLELEVFSRDCFLAIAETLKYDIGQSEGIWKEYHDRLKEYAKIRKLEVF